ncbi:CBU_1268 family Dot/Icm T4SS effector [Coxiella burnetii]|uniref:CBU_1268 family Dot/Icm T4SS effector n=1 Tax=Coxiella burnetii TaxID=777 RepID=UPI000183CDA2|nr:CBU_1268 family Dot/Icm T4SS effector [Coxiella burnetii]ACJ18139.1 hypothetical protein CbuG_0742 [Coxiella burnetii CbuG_Q212]OYK86448.1 pyridine nucleotide-disulfide oxidoreductase [Coxiella burnetii]
MRELMTQKLNFDWAVVGAGPAGTAAVGELLDAGVDAQSIAWIDLHFQVGDFGRYWGEVTSNTRVHLFLEFLTGYRAFNYANKTCSFPIDSFEKTNFCLLKHVAEPLQWIADYMRNRVVSYQTYVNELSVQKAEWHLQTQHKSIKAKKVILATGAYPKTLPFHEKLNEKISPIEIYDALHPLKLAKRCQAEDTVAVFGSSHSSMLIIRELTKIGVKKIINFYLAPIRFALPLGDWILYDNTGLKGETAKWVRENIIQQCLPSVERYPSTEENIRQFLPQCTKTIYAVGFFQRAPLIREINLSDYDVCTGIIAPGLFGTGIGFPRQVTTPLGATEMNVGLWKFMHDIRKVMPIWQQYGL